MAITHLGSGICRYRRSTAGAIFHVTVPDTIIRSACLGDARNTSMPKRAMSHLDMALAIISKAQQARPKESGHSDALLPQFRTVSMVVTAKFRFSPMGTSSIGSANGPVCVALRWFI